MKKNMLVTASLVALLIPMDGVAQSRRGNADGSATETAQPRSGSGDQEKAKPRESPPPPKTSGRSTPEAKRDETRERDRRAERYAHRPDPARVVFIGGYFYDPYFGRAPWWPLELYPHIMLPTFEPLARVRITLAPRAAAVYVDGFYAGVVDDFDGIFQSLQLLPGGHTITLYLPGYRTVTRHIFLTAQATWKLEEPMALLPPGVASELPSVANMPPPPPAGTYLPPPTPRMSQPGPMSGARVPLGTLSLRVQPETSLVTIDGLAWSTTGPGVLVLQLTPGRHHVDVETTDHQSYAADFDIDAFRTTELNISVPDTAR